MLDCRKWGAILIILAFFLVGCNDQLLDLQPQSELTSDTFWKTKDDAKIALTGVYSSRSWMGETAIISLESVTDNGIRTGVEASLGLFSGQLTPSDGTVSGLWESSYEQISRSNNFLENIKGADMDEGEKREMIAEVRFLRAWAYYNLSQYWGSVPLVKKVLTMQEANSVNRVPKEEVVDFVLTQLTEAAKNLPVTRPAAEHGRIIKSAALAVKGRLLLAEERWSEAASVYKKIMDLGVHSIDPDYKALFDGTKEQSDEIILSSKYIKNQVYNGLQRDVRPNLYGGWHHYNPYQNLIDAYLCKDGKNIRESSLCDSNQPYKNRDPRLYHNFFLPGYTEFAGKIYRAHPDSSSAGDSMGGENPLNTGYAIKKYVDEDYEGNIYTGGTDIPIIRYAEVLLSYLEAKIKSEESITQSLLDQTINKVRERSSVDMPPVIETNPSKLWEIVKLERRVELPYEGIHYWDLLRWREFHNVLNRTFYGMKLTNNPESYDEFRVNEEGHYEVYTMTFNKDKDYQWPIPQDEIDVNPNLEQFPEY
jgi:hypothetical protein